MTDDFTPILEQDHWLDWIGDDPPQEVRRRIESLLREEYPTLTLECVRLTGEPVIHIESHSENGKPEVLSDGALVVKCELTVRSERGAQTLHGVFSWVAARLHKDRIDRAYLDIDADLEWSREILEDRLYSLDTSTE